MNRIEVLLPENAGETARFAAAELKHFLSGGIAAEKITVRMQLEPERGEEEFLLGGCRDYALSGGSETALLYGAYELLKQFGFRFYSPDPWDTVVPAGPVCPPEVRVHFLPAFEWRGFFAVEKRDTEDFLLWMARNYMNYWTGNVNHPELCRKLGMKLRGNPPSGMHRLFEDYLSPAEYAQEHPEYYALHDGERVFSFHPENPWNPCTSNPDAARLLAENIVNDLNPGGRLGSVSSLTFAPFDNGHWCECENCAAQGNRTARLLLLADRCSKEIRRKVKRPVRLIVPAYHETLPPPDSVLPEDFDYERIAIEFFPIERCYAHTIDDPGCPANAMLKRYYDAWSRLGKFQLLVCEYYNVSTFASAALVFDDTIPHDLEFYRRTGSCYISYMHVSTALWGELAVSNCAFASVAAGLEFSRSDLLEKRYGPAAAAMTHFYELLQRFSHLAKPLFHYVGTGKMRPDGSGTYQFSFEQALLCHRDDPPYFMPGHFEEESGSADIPSLKEAFVLLDEAAGWLERADSDGNKRVRQCLETDRMRFLFTVRRVRFTWTLLRLLRAEKSGAQAEARKLADELRLCGEALRRDTLSIAHIRAAGAPNLNLYVNALTPTRLQRQYGAKMRQYGLEIQPFKAEEGVTVIQG